MTEEQPEPLTDDELAELWAEIGREALQAEAMNQSLAQKLRRYDHERERARGSNVRPLRPPGEDHPQHVREEFRPRPSGERAPFNFPPLPPGDEGTEDSSSL